MSKLSLALSFRVRAFDQKMSPNCTSVRSIHTRRVTYTWSKPYDYAYSQSAEHCTPPRVSNKKIVLPLFHYYTKSMKRTFKENTYRFHIHTYIHIYIHTYFYQEH